MSPHCAPFVSPQDDTQKQFIAQRNLKGYSQKDAIPDDLMDNLIFDWIAVHPSALLHLRIGTIAECPEADHMYQPKLKMGAAMCPPEKTQQ